MVKTIVPKKSVVVKKKDGVYRLTFELSMDGPNSGGEGIFWVDLAFWQFYNSQDEDNKPASDTEESVSAFLSDWIEEEGLQEVLMNLEVLEMCPISLTVERRD